MALRRSYICRTNACSLKAIQDGTPLKPSYALAPKRTARSSIYLLTQTGVPFKSPKPVVSRSIQFALSENAKPKTIAERKKTLAAMLTSVAELGASRMEETIGK